MGFVLTAKRSVFLPIQLELRSSATPYNPIRNGRRTSFSTAVNKQLLVLMFLYALELQLLLCLKGWDPIYFLSMI